jgi:hypothetical protein
VLGSGLIVLAGYNTFYRDEVKWRGVFSSFTDAPGYGKPHHN